MRSFLTVAALLQSLVHLASAQASNETSSACPEQGGVHIIVARASLEPLGYGTIGAVKDSILQRIPGSNAEFVVYPATLDQYTTSESDGVVAARALINAYIENCPNQPLVVMGYSQGAQVTADSLVGQDVRNFPVNESIRQPLPESTLGRVAGVILMGDPSATTDQPFHVGNATNNSLFPRQNNQNWDIADIGAVTQSYCDAGDPYCAAPGNSLATHVTYVGVYGVDASNFIVEAVVAWYADQGETITPGTASSTASSAAATSSQAAVSSTSAAASATSASSAHASSSVASRSAAPTASVSQSVPAASSTPSSTLSTYSAAYTGAASSLQITGAGMGAVVAALLALM